MNTTIEFYFYYSLITYSMFKKYFGTYEFPTYPKPVTSPANQEINPYSNLKQKNQ